MARFVLLEATPWRVVDGSAERVRIAGGGSKPYSGLRGFTDWRSGLAAFPMFVASAGFGEKGWTGSAIPQTSQIGIFPSDEALRSDLLSKYLWKGAPIELRSGDDESAPGTYLMELSGTVDNLAVSEGAIVLTVADLAASVNVPVVTAKYAGSGGIEGPVEAAGRPKRRSWGYVRNVEGFLLDKPNNIFEFGDPSFPLNAFVAVRDMGRDASPAPGVIAWQGSIAATLTALQAATPGQGTCTVAPSIACVKWWTAPVGPLTADIEGEVGVGYVNKVADIAERIVGSAAPTGVELVTNGAFGTTDGWASALGGTLSVVGGKLRVTNASSFGSATQAIATVAGRAYRFVAEYTAGTAPGGYLKAGTTAGGFELATLSAAAGANALNFTATGATTYLTLQANSTTAGQYADFDNASARQYTAFESGSVAALNAIRAAVSGIHVGDENETVAQSLDRLLIPVNAIWGINPDGTVRLSEIQLTTVSDTLTAIDVERLETYRPIWQVKLGYKKNHRQHSDGEISAALLLGGVTGPSEATAFKYDYLGAAESGELPRDLSFKLLWGDGSTLTSGVTWQYRVVSGTVNGFTTASGWQNMTGTGIGVLTVSSLGSDSATVEVKAAYGGETRQFTAPALTKQVSAPPTGGGGGGPVTVASKSSGFAAISSTTFSDTTGSLTGSMPAGVTAATISVNLTIKPVTTGGVGAWTVECKAQRLISGVWTDVGATASLGSDVYDANAGDTPAILRANGAAFVFTRSDSSIPAGSNSWRVMARLTSGSRTHNVTGSVSVTA